VSKGKGRKSVRNKQRMFLWEGSEEGRTLSDVQSSQEIWQGLRRNKVGGISKTVPSGGIPSPIQLL